MNCNGRWLCSKMYAAFLSERCCILISMYNNFFQISAVSIQIPHILVLQSFTKINGIWFELGYFDYFATPSDEFITDGYFFKCQKQRNNL